jgi:hypothetical protein
MALLLSGHARQMRGFINDGDIVIRMNYELFRHHREKLGCLMYIELGFVVLNSGRNR